MRFSLRPGQNDSFMVRPESISISDSPTEGRNSVDGIVHHRIPSGGVSKYFVEVAGQITLSASSLTLRSELGHRPRETVRLERSVHDMVVPQDIEPSATDTVAHGVLKSGCRIEFLQFQTADHLQRAIAINAVIAWRIMAMTLLGRQGPDCEPQLLFADHELDFLRDYALENGLRTADRLGESVRLVAHLEGYRDRKHDPDPGKQIMWHGQTRLSSAALGHRIGFRGRPQARKTSGRRACCWVIVIMTR